MRLIDADRMKEELLWGNVFLPAIQTNTLVDLIDNQPTIDPESLRVERMRGEWISDLTGQKVDAEINEDGLLDDNDGVHCSICGGWLTASDEYCCAARFCPHCGAKMED